MLSEFLRLSPKISVLPVVHGSGDFAIEARRVMLTNDFDCLAVPLPGSFQASVERAVEFLPSITAVVQRDRPLFGHGMWSDSDGNDFGGGDDSEQPEFGEAPQFQSESEASYVPIDPCQAVITAIRIAIQEHIPRYFIDLETERFEPISAVFPDPYALKKVSVDHFAAAVLPGLSRLPSGQPQDRLVTMASRLRELESRHSSILLICSLLEWPWIREAYQEKRASAENDLVVDPEIFAVDPQTLLFFLGELPFITGLYERARAELDDDENLSVDGVKELLLAARDQYQLEFGTRARSITPKLLSVYFQYVRNLSLVDRRMTPDYYTLVVAAQQIMGDQFAVNVAESARNYIDAGTLPFPMLEMGIERGRFPSGGPNGSPNGETLQMVSRLPGPPISWRSCRLNPRPPKQKQSEWQMRWDIYRQCSWPAEDVSIEKFRTHVKEQALSLLAADFARSEKFTTSLKDGLDIRETLRNWHTGDLYVKENPPTRGTLDCVVMLFDSPADPRDYPWRITWQAEHDDESTLALFATDFQQELVGPGIALAHYGGAMFLFPPRPIVDIWQDPDFDYADTLEERLLAAAFSHSEEKHIALLSSAPPGAGWRRLAKKYGKKLIHIPLKKFSQQKIQQLRTFHVLNGQEVRSYAAHFIRNS